MDLMDFQLEIQVHGVERDVAVEMAEKCAEIVKAAVDDDVRRYYVILIPRPIVAAA